MKASIFKRPALVSNFGEILSRTTPTIFASTLEVTLIAFLAAFCAMASIPIRRSSREKPIRPAHTSRVFADALVQEEARIILDDLKRGRRSSYKGA